MAGEPRLHISKIVEFRLFLDGQAVSWYSQNDAAEFADFDELREQFIQQFLYEHIFADLAAQLS